MCVLWVEIKEDEEHLGKAVCRVPHVGLSGCVCVCVVCVFLRVHILEAHVYIYVTYTHIHVTYIHIHITYTYLENIGGHFLVRALDKPDTHARGARDILAVFKQRLPHHLHVRQDVLRPAKDGVVPAPAEDPGVRRIHVCHMRRRIHVCCAGTCRGHRSEEDTCVSYEDEDTCVLCRHLQRTQESSIPTGKY